VNARESILTAARSASLPRIELPNIDLVPAVSLEESEVARVFIGAAREAGAEVLLGERTALLELVRQAAPQATRVMSELSEVPSSVVSTADVSVLAGLELFACEAMLGVAENGAMWLPRSHLGARAAPFLAEHMIVVLERATLVANLHEAYKQIDAAAESFGVFVAGPSKTADIEQALVMGAHGPKRLTVLLVYRDG